MNRREFIVATTAAALAPVAVAAPVCTSEVLFFCVDEHGNDISRPIVINQMRDLRLPALESCEEYFQRRYHELLREACAA